MSKPRSGAAARNRHRKPADYPRRAFIYRRISDDRNGLEKGIDRQLADCERIAERNGWEVVRVFTENDVSASRYGTKVRKQFLLMLAALEAGEADAVITWDSSRLTRLPVELERLFDLADVHDVVIEFETGTLDTRTAEGRFFGRMLAAQAAMESDNTSKRQRAMHRHRAMAGLPSGGPRIYGWADDQITEVEHEQQHLRRCVDELLKGRPIDQVIREQHARGMVTTGGDVWCHRNLTGLLLGPRAIGQRHYEGKAYRAVWGPIMTTDEQAQLAALISKRRRGPNKGGAPVRHLLGGIAVCGKCKTKLVGNTYRGKYVCPSNRGCGGCTVSIAELNREVAYQWAGAWDERISKAVARRKAKRGKVQRADLGAELARIAGKLEVWAKREADGKCTEAEWETATDTLRERQAELTDQLQRELDAELTEDERRFGGDPARYFNRLPDVADQRAELLRIIDRVEVEAMPHGGSGPDCRKPTEDRATVHWR